MEEEASADTMNGEISPEPDEVEYVRIARLMEYDEGWGKFAIEDVLVEQPNIYERLPVAVGFVFDDDIPEKYETGYVFRTVPEDEGEFVVANDAGTHRNGSFTENSPTVGLVYDEDFHQRYREIARRVSQQLKDDSEEKYGAEGHTYMDEL